MRSILVGAVLLLAGCSSGSNSGGNSDSDECRLNVQLSGGLDAKLGDTSQACVYTARAVGFAPLDGQKVLVYMFVRKIEAGQTGTFPAEVTVDAGQDHWARGVCSVDVESNVPAPPTYDAGLSFNPHLLKGKGSCSSPAVFQGDGGTKPPVDIGPFTFTFTTLFY